MQVPKQDLDELYKLLEALELTMSGNGSLNAEALGHLNAVKSYVYNLLN